MSICQNCEKAGEKAIEVFTMKERMFLASSTLHALQVLARNPVREDLEVANSVLTKMLLTFPMSGRQAMLDYYRKFAGVDIVLGSCPHSINLIS